MDKKFTAFTLRWEEFDRLNHELSRILA